MCQLCKDAVDHFLPNFTASEKMDVLWSETAFPFATGDQTARQVQDFARSITQNEGAD